MPLIRRIPKRGFNNARFKINYLPVNLSALNAFADGDVVDVAALRKAGLATGKSDGIKILGQGILERRLTVKANAFSATAKAAIEKLGGTVEIAA
jgi:large subunit ribosomal protein L15